MSGVLDSKKRIMDVILTEIGRDQMNRGEFEVSFVSFSDKGSEYIDDGTGVAANINDRFYFESYSSPSDEIIAEIDNVGDFVLTKKLSPTLTVNNGILYQKSETGYDQVDGYANIEAFTNILPNRYKGLQIIRSYTETPDFDVSQTSLELKTNRKISQIPDNVGLIKPMLVDERFTGTINTLYLPPIALNKGKVAPLKAFNRFGPENTETNVLSEIQRKSWSTARIEIGTDDTYKDYNILGQVFMKKDQTVKKYLIVDAGEYLNEKNEIIMQIYHLGFIYKDENGTSKFSRAFSLVFHNRE